MVYERSNSTVNDSEYSPYDSQTTNITTNSTIPSLSNNDEKENRRIIDVQCKIKTKETGSSLVNKRKTFIKNKKTFLLSF